MTSATDGVAISIADPVWRQPFVNSRFRVDRGGMCRRISNCSSADGA